MESGGLRMKFAVSYELEYVHRVMVGIEASSEEEAQQVAEEHFDQGTIWDDTLALPLLFDDFEEKDDNVLEWKVESIESFPDPDASVLEIRRKEYAFAACRALIQAMAFDEKPNTNRLNEAVRLARLSGE